MERRDDDYFSSYNDFTFDDGTRGRMPVTLHESNNRLPVDIFDQVKMDLDARNAKGYAIHSRVLDDTVEKDFLLEAYEEALDLSVYLRGELTKRERNRG